ncbi:MAG: ABC transporter permease [Bacteroidales bacterium]|nr:ABC transporter permease [Bacteroidales bacterium]
MRFDIDRYKEIIDTLSRNRSRTLLTGFGIFWGIFMLLVMLGGGDGLKKILSENFSGFASNSIIIGSNNTSKPYGGFKRDRYWLMDKSDIEAIKTLVPEADVVTMMESQWGYEFVYEDKSYSGILKGLTSDYLGVESPKMRYGRWLNDVDCEQERKVCVLGSRVWENLFPGEEDPTGKHVRIKGTYYQVIGVDDRKAGININGSPSESIVIPYQLMDRMFNKGGKFDIICMTLKGGVDSDTAQDKVRRLLARRHTIDPDDKQGIMMLDTEKIFSIVDNLFKGVNILVILVGLGTLLAGAIGVSNIMMVTVKERTTEIGIRRAIGATPKMILSQIITESIGLTVLAGMFGILFSVLILWGAGQIVSSLPDMGGGISFQIGFWTGILVLSLLVVLGVLAGLAPALRAMEIKPVDAMREE